MTKLKDSGAHNKLAALTLIILFSEMLKLSNFVFADENYSFVKESIESAAVFCLLKWKFQT